MNKTRGRPIKEDSKNRQYRIRLTDDEMKRLDYMSSKNEKTKADVIRDALDIYYKMSKFNE